MIKIAYLYCLFMLLIVSNGGTNAQLVDRVVNRNKPFVHPGILQTREDMAFMKQKVKAGEQPWKDAFERLKKTTSLDFQPQPFTHVIRGSYGRPSIGGKELSASAEAAYTHALLWYLTDDKAYARKAIEILNAWSATLWDFDDNDAKVLAGWTGHLFCNAAEILRYTPAGWQEADHEQFKRMLLSAYYPLIKNYFPEANGNWDAALIHTILCIAIYCDDRPMFEQAIARFQYGSGNGGLTKYIYPTGQCQESTRDQSHTQLGLGYFAQAAQVAWTQGIDLYSMADNRLATGFEYTAQYMLGHDVPVYGLISPDGRGRFQDIYEPVLAHYLTKGVAMPYTAQLVDSTRRKSTIVTLTAYRAGMPKSSKPNVITLGIASTLCGAITQTTGVLLTNPTSLHPGDSIQAALNEQAKTGGWVVLGKGVYSLKASLRIPSSVSLVGQGLETILLLESKNPVDHAAIVNATDDLHDVLIRDLVVEGSTSGRTSRDPNQDRRQRATQLAPRRAGILFSAQREGQMNNIRLEHITVQNCTLSGVAIRGASQVNILDCDFSDNGGSVVPGQGLLHNLLLTHVTDALVSGCRLDTSPWGNGLDLTNSQQVHITNNELARNAQNGIRMADCQSVHISGNRLEGNDGSGLSFDKLATDSRRIELRSNRSQYNGQYGLAKQASINVDLITNILTTNRLSGQGVP